MMYLIAKMFLLLVLAAVLGFLLGYWWVRRQFRDVTEEYGRLLASGTMKDYTPALEGINRDVVANRAELAGLVRGIEGRLRDLVAAEVAKVKTLEAPRIDLTSIETKIAAFRAEFAQVSERPVDLGPIEARLRAIEEALRALPEPPAPVEADLSGIDGQLAEIRAALDGLDLPPPVDVDPLLERFDAVERAVRSIRIPEPEAVDLGPMNVKIEALESAMRAFDVPEPATVDLAPIQSQMAEIEANIAAIDRSASAVVDLEPVRVRLAELEEAVRAIEIPPPTRVDLTPLQLQLTAFEQWVKGTLDKPDPPPAGPPMFKSATFGPKDDLKRISGVGEVLERLLNELGVYYFFQVASWSPADVKHVDDRLEVFKGRIERDDWVKQAKVLAKTSRAKPPPGMMDTSFGLEPGAEIPPTTSDAPPDRSA